MLNKVTNLIKRIKKPILTARFPIYLTMVMALLLFLHEGIVEGRWINGWAMGFLMGICALMHYCLAEMWKDCVDETLMPAIRLMEDENRKLRSEIRKLESEIKDDGEGWKNE